MNTLNELLEKAPEIEDKIGYTFKDKNLLALAFVHCSFVNENKDVTEKHNERLEFLGDSVLGLHISNFLYQALPHTPEGELSKFRSRLVEASSCSAYLEKLQVEEYLLLGKGEQRNWGRGRASILADLFEALIGAIFLDGTAEASSYFLFDHFTSEFNAILNEPHSNWKAILQDYSQKHHHSTPKYIVNSSEGPDHSKIFCISVYIDNQEIGIGQGSSKKEAQQKAAEDAIAKLGISNDSELGRQDGNSTKN